MSDLDQILEILERHLSAVNARVLLQKALRERGLSIDAFERSDLKKIATPLKRGMELFVRADRRELALQEIADLCGNDTVRPASCSIAIVSESDISVARNEARRVCQELGAKSFAMQKVTTIVSELARNIVSYTPGGKLELSSVREKSRRVIVRAVDHGQGIPNLEEIMSGRYRSKTGLGRGLLGTKRLADLFEISTGAGGTSILAEVHV